MFTSIELHGWRQFQDVNLDLGAPMTVITGANGSGKTTVLHVLSRHFGWNLNWISTRLKSKKGKSGLWADVRQMLERDFSPQNNAYPVGQIFYTNGESCELSVPPNVNEQYSLNYSNQQPVEGLHIPSHSQPFSYHKVPNIPTDPKNSAQQFQEYHSLLMQVYQSDRARNPGTIIKSSIISLAVFGFGNRAVTENAEFAQIFEAFEDKLRLLLPTVLGFERIEIRMPDVILVTKTGEFPLDSVSGGVGALVGIAWQILMYSMDKHRIVVTFDEPENHLHPAMQRELLPNLQRAFPGTQFIIATHSPFIVTSNPDANIYALKFDDNRVTSKRLAKSELAGDFSDTLRSILDVPVTIPKWVEETLKSLYLEVKQKGLTADNIKDFRKRLRELDMLPQFLDMADELGGGDA